LSLLFRAAGGHDKEENKRKSLPNESGSKKSFRVHMQCRAK
jgi:hypothetical protein